jgi:hypothetical protein
VIAAFLSKVLSCCCHAACCRKQLMRFAVLQGNTRLQRAADSATAQNSLRAHNSRGCSWQLSVVCTAGVPLLPSQQHEQQQCTVSTADSCRHGAAAAAPASLQQSAVVGATACTSAAAYKHPYALLLLLLPPDTPLLLSAAAAVEAADLVGHIAPSQQQQPAV